MTQILVGIIGIPAGFAMLKYIKEVKGFVGDIDWAEKHIGMGGTYSLLKFVAIMISILSFLYMTGTLQSLIWDFFGPISGRGGY